MTNYVRSLRLQDFNGQNLAEILMPDKIEDEPVLLMPNMGMYFEAQQDHSRPHVRTSPHRMHSESFLRYLASIASAADPNPALALHLSGTSPANQYCDVALARNMQADDLAEMTGLLLDRVRHFLASHLTFGPPNE